MEDKLKPNPFEIMPPDTRWVPSGRKFLWRQEWKTDSLRSP